MTLKKENIKRILVILLIVFLFLTLTGCSSDMDGSALDSSTYSDEDFLGKFFVYPIGWIMSTVGNWFNGSYGISIIIVTIIVRFALWPIYAGTTNMSFNMQLAQPSIDKVNAKYLGRDDPESQQKKTQEIMAIYKEYNISFKSCLAMPIQSLLFIGLTRAMTRVAIAGGSLSLSNFSLFGFDLRGELWSSDYGLGSQIFTGVLVALVALTCYFQQFLIQRKNKSLNASGKTKSAQAMQTEKFMKVFTYGFPIILAWMASSSTAYALYWTIGTTCSIVTMLITHKLQAKKLAEIKARRENDVDIFDKEVENTSNESVIIEEENNDAFSDFDKAEIITTNNNDNIEKKSNDDIIDIE